MEASASAIPQQIIINATQPEQVQDSSFSLAQIALDRINLFITLLGVTSAIILAILTIIFVILGFLVYEIKPVQELVAESEEEPQEVVNIRIPRREKKEETKIDEKDEVVQKPEVDTVETEPAESETPEIKINPAQDEAEKTSSTSASLSSFSLLDADASNSDNKSSVEPDKPETLVEPTTDMKVDTTQTTSSSNSMESSNSEDTKTATTDDVKNWLNDASADESNKSGSGKKIFLSLFLVFIVMLLVGGGVYYYQMKIGKPQSVAVNLEEESEELPTSTPSPTIEPVDLALYSVEILNGSGKPGEAGNVEVLLTEAGFEEIDTGNASRYDYEETEVMLKADTPDEVFNIIKDTIGASYVVIKSSKALEEDNEYDVVITVGSSEPEPSASPIPTESEE